MEVNTMNPLKSWWFKAAASLDPVFAFFGYAIVLRRSPWTRSHSRLALWRIEL